MRRIALLGLFLVMSLVVSAGALAFNLAPGRWLYAKPKQYVIEMIPQCAHQTYTCKNAKYFALEMGFGNVDKTTGACPSGGFNSPQIPLTNDAFDETFRTTLGSKAITVTLTGTFLSDKKAKGTIVGPKGCGGKASWTAVPQSKS